MIFIFISYPYFFFHFFQFIIVYFAFSLRKIQKYSIYILQGQNTKYTTKQNCQMLLQQKKLPINPLIKPLQQFSVLLLYFLTVLSLPFGGNAFTVQFASSSAVVGAVASYSIAIKNHTNPTTIFTTFSAWTPWQSQPYLSNYQFSLNSGTFSNVILSCRTRSVQTIQCTMPTTSPLGSIIQLTVTNIYNPSSTKPYLITVTLRSANLPDEAVSNNLTVKDVKISDIVVTNWNSTVVATSSASFVIPVDYYFDTNTILKIVHTTSLINFTYNPSTAYFVNSTNTNGTVTTLINRWTDTSRGVRILNNISTTNPAASFLLTLNCFLYFIENNITYNIQNYTIKLQVTTSAFSSITATSSLLLGVSNQNISASALTCPYTPNNKTITTNTTNTTNTTTNTSYTQISFSTLDFTISTCTNSTNTSSTKTCTYTSSVFPKTITGITQDVKPDSSTSITFTVYTYFSPLSNYYPLCSQSYSIQLLPQTFNTTAVNFNTALCSLGSINGKTGDLNNNTVLSINMQSMKAGDIVTIYSLLGIISTAAWQRINNTNNYRYTLTSLNTNSTSLITPLQYSNPTYISLNKLTNITVSRISNNTQYIYATLVTGSIGIPLCPTTIISDLQSFSFALSSFMTYKPDISMTIRFRNKFKDYLSTDYIAIQFRYFQNVLYLTNSQLLPNIKCTINTTTSNSSIVASTNLNVINNTLINIFNITQINSVSTGSEVVISGLANPSVTYPTSNISSGFQIAIILFDGVRSVGKEQYVVNFSSISQQNQYSYITNSVSVTQSSRIPIFSSIPSLTLTLTNTNKSKYYNNMGPTTYLISLPANFTCTETNNTSRSMNITSQSFISDFTVTLTNCNIGFMISSSANVNINQTMTTNNVSLLSPSTYTTSILGLFCNDYCQSCTQVKYCTKCVNSTYSSFTLLYNGICYNTCPTKTYEVPNQTSKKCQDCHASCQTCVNGSLVGCTSCAQFYTVKQVNVSTQTGVTTFRNVCVSVCGEGMFINPSTGKCQVCQIDCKYCVNAQYCYVCKQGAGFVSSTTCDFIACNDPCRTCQGNWNNCTSCVSPQYWYDYLCYTTCPTGTYSTFNTTKNMNMCMDISSPTLYFPATICSIVLIALVCICNTCIERNMTADANRRNINMLTYSSSILAYMQLFALFIMIAFTFNDSSKILGVVGLVLWVLCNVLFGVYYYKVMLKDQAVSAVVNKMSQGSKCIYITTVVCSIAFTLRTYRVLYCGLFRGVAPYPVKKVSPPMLKKRKGSQAKIANEDINIKIVEETNQKNIGEKNVVNVIEQKNLNPIKTKSSFGLKTGSIGKNSIINSNKNLKNYEQTVNMTNTKNSQKIPKTVQESSIQESEEEHSKFQLKRPYIIYLTLGTILGSILFLAAGVNEIVKKIHPGMLFWGLDILIVVVASIIVTFLDMWAGIKKSYLMALEKGDTNQTMENLRLDEEEGTQQKIMNSKTQKIGKNNSPNKMSIEDKKALMKKYSPPPRKNSKSPRSQQKTLSPQQKQQQEKMKKMKKIKSRYSDLYKRKKNSDEPESEEDDDLDQLPDIKVFQDVEMFVNDDIEPAIKKLKKVKNSDKRMNSVTTMRRGEDKSINQIGNSTLYKNSKLSWKVDDIFLGFEQKQDITDFDKKTIKVKKEKSLSKKEEKQQKKESEENKKNSNNQKNQSKQQEQNQKQAQNNPYTKRSQN